MRDKDGKPLGTVRSHLLAAARMGSAAAREELATEPECPEEVVHVVEWAYMLHGRSGMGMDGYAPLGYATIESWARLSGIEVSALDVEALVQLDAAIRNPEPPEAVPDEEEGWDSPPGYTADGDGQQQERGQQAPTGSGWPKRRRPPELEPNQDEA